jgi:hypothetical protein
MAESSDNHGEAEPLDAEHDQTRARGLSHGLLVHETMKRGPGKAKQFDVGNEHIDDGPACEADPGGTECFLADKQRERLVGWIERRVSTAQTNYKLALVDLKVAELVKKPDDLHWMLGLALDLVGAHLMVTVGNMLKGLRTSGLQKLGTMSIHNAMAGLDDSKWARRAMTALHAVGPTKIDGALRAGFGLATPKAKDAAKEEQNEAATATKTQEAAYLDRLRDGCDLGFERFLSNVLAGSSDAELVLIYEAFAPEHHSVGIYVQELGDKLKRFMRSGVPEIGESKFHYGDGALHSETRVVLVQDIHGVQTPWYSTKTDDHQGRGHVARGEAQLGRPVPDEFRDAAVAASEARFGTTPVIDDGFVALLKANRINVSVMRGQLRGGAMVTKEQARVTSSPFPSHASPPKESGSLPAGSVFDEQRLTPEEEAMARALGLLPGKT